MALVNGKQNYSDACAYWTLRLLRRINRLARLEYISEAERMELQELFIPDLWIDRRGVKPRKGFVPTLAKRVG